MTGRRALLPFLALSLAACERVASRPAATDAASAPPAPALPDSLVAAAPGDVTVWLTFARDAADSTGRPCVERAIEIRRGGVRVPVPLLYTGGVPEVVDDTTLRARLWKDCRPGDSYLVDLRRGQPIRERPQPRKRVAQ